MMLSRMRTLAERQLRDLPPAVRLILIHPNFAAQHWLLSLFGQSYAYMRFHGASLNEEQLWQQYAAALQPQSAATYILLEECDRAEPASFVLFVRRLLAEAGDARIVLFSRTLLPALMQDASLHQMSAFLPVNETEMLADYANRTGESALLEVYALGSGRVLLNGKEIKNWDGVLPRALFFYLVDRGMVTRAEIFQTFWPTLPVREATNVFHVTKRKINEVLDADLTVYWSGFYHISPTIQLSYDIGVFNKLLQDSQISSPIESRELLYRAISLYRGDFLSGMELEWARTRRVSVRQTYSDALVSLGRLVDDEGETGRALSLFLRAARIQRGREDLVGNIMRLYDTLHMPAEGLRVYHMLTQELQRSLGVEPSAALQAQAASLQLSG